MNPYILLAALMLFSPDTSNQDAREFGREPGGGVEVAAGVATQSDGPVSLRAEVGLAWLPKERHGDNSRGQRLSADGRRYEVKAATVGVYPEIEVYPGVSVFVGGGAGLAVGDYTGPVVKVAGGVLAGLTEGLDISVSFSYFDASGYDVYGPAVGLVYNF